MVPSFLAPILTSIEVEDVGPVALKTSSRLITTLTGRLALRDSASAIGSIHTWVLPPKPPPISDAVTRSFEMSMPRTWAETLRTMKWPWVQTHSSPLPSGDTLARQAWGSM